MTSDPSKRIVKEVTAAIMRSSLDEETKKKLLPKNPIVPRIYGLPKVQKQDTPLRPIVNTIGSPTYRLAKYLAGKLKRWVGHTDSFVKNSTDMVDEIKRARIKNEDTLVSFDVVSLYTKIPIEEAIKTIKEITDEETTELVSVCLKSTFFTFRECFYEQVEGVAMGSPYLQS